jgi:hypothetical protein
MVFSLEGGFIENSKLGFQANLERVSGKTKATRFQVAWFQKSSLVQISRAIEMTAA